MSGHSKWSTIKHKKGALDKKRGKIFRVIRATNISSKPTSLFVSIQKKIFSTRKIRSLLGSIAKKLIQKPALFLVRKSFF